MTTTATADWDAGGDPTGLVHVHADSGDLVAATLQQNPQPTGPPVLTLDATLSLLAARRLRDGLDTAIRWIEANADPPT